MMCSHHALCPTKVDSQKDAERELKSKDIRETERNVKRTMTRKRNDGKTDGLTDRETEKEKHRERQTGDRETRTLRAHSFPPLVWLRASLLKLYPFPSAELDTALPAWENQGAQPNSPLPA